jgi:mannose-6-phosphate isomerase-like protein (cupin superfamily)
MSVFVTDREGKPLSDVLVKASGPVERDGTTDAEGNILFQNLTPGSYRLRYEHAAYVTLEQEVNVQTARAAKVSAALTAAPPPPPPPKPEPSPPPPRPASTLPPAGEATSVSIPDFFEKNYIGNAPSKQSAVGCSGGASATLLQLRDPLQEHVHVDGDEMFYVVAGEGTQRILGRDVNLAAGTFAVVPRGTSHAITRRGSRPLVLLTILSGPACQQGK